MTIKKKKAAARPKAKKPMTLEQRLDGRFTFLFEQLRAEILQNPCCDVAKCVDVGGHLLENHARALDYIRPRR